ncbi:MAG: peptide ABC transporter substrate-binding protein [Lachnospiraceae bacterium]|nr:peptide ABC transporter substrate-binding protein [Lachnospiraceae bacterium]
MSRMSENKRRIHIIGPRVLSALAALLLAGGTLAGCGARIPSADPEHEINYYVVYQPSDLDPQTVFDVGNMPIVGLFSESVMSRNEEGRLIYGLADRYEKSEDGCLYTFHIRDDARWSDGVPVTAADFVFGWQRVVNPDTASNASFLFLNCMKLEGVEEIFYQHAPLDTLGIHAVDDHTFTVSLLEPCPYLLDLLVNNAFSPCREDFFYAHKGEYMKKAGAFLSCGAFVPDYYEPLGMQLHLSKNPYYYDAEIVQVSGVNVQVLSDQQQLIMSFEKGEADIIPISGEQQEVAQGDPRLTEIPGALIYYVIPNLDNEIFGNRNIRRAMALCVNRDEIVNSLLRAGNYPLTRIIPEGIVFEEDGTDFGGDPDQFADLCGYQPELARSYWEKGLQELGITKVTAEFLTSSESNTFMDILKKEWEKNLPGFSMKYRVVPPKAYNQELHDGHFDLALTGWSADYADPTAYLALFTPDNYANVGHYNSPAFNKVFAESAAVPLALDPQARMEKLHEAERILMEEMAVIPAVTVGEARMVSDRVKGVYMGALVPHVNFKYAVKEAK